MTIVLDHSTDSPWPQEVMARAAQRPLTMPRRGIGLQQTPVVDPAIPVAGISSAPSQRERDESGLSAVTHFGGLEGHAAVLSA